MYGLVTIAGPTQEPVTVAEAKLHLRIDHSADNDEIASFIKTVRRLTEEYCSKRWVEQTLRLTLPAWPCNGIVRLPVEPVKSVASVKYLDADGVLQTISNTLYQTWLDGSPPIIAPGSPVARNVCWPTLQTGDIAPIRIEFTAGYGSAASVPDEVKTAMKLWLTYWYENRGDGRDPNSGLESIGMPPAVRRILSLVESGRY